MISGQIVIICFISLFCVIYFYLFFIRSNQVSKIRDEIRNAAIKNHGDKKAFDRWQNMPSYQTMTFKFWIPLSKYAFEKDWDE